MTVLARPAAVARASLRVRVGGRVGAYVALTKPRIIELLLVTTLPAMVLAAHGVPPLGLTAATLVGGAAAAGSANALNCYVDRDIDALMRRTATRPIIRSTVSPRAALVFGLVLGALAVAGLWVVTSPLAAALTLAAIAVYVLGYTLVLKRRTSSNIVWGGAAGCMPTLIGWAAVDHSLAPAPFVLFAIVFFWTPPHFWALAMRFSDDYAAAGVPMLPVVATPQVVVRRMTVYTWLTVAASLALWPVAGTGPLYPAGAAVAGVLFLREVHALRRRVAAGEQPRPMRVFHASISYLTLLFGWLAVAVVVGAHL